MMDTMMAAPLPAPAMGFFFPFLYILCMLACLAAIAGFVFLLTWALRTLTPKMLKKWGIILLIVALVLCVISCIATPSRHMKVKMMRSMDGGMMMNGEHMMMQMDMMSSMLKGKTGDDFDKAFLEGMIPHHQGAIDMANLAAANAKHVEIKNMAKAIITAQQKEITQMQQWQKAWGYTK